MPTLRANVTTPWARAGQTFEVDKIEPVHQHHLDNKVLTDVTPAARDAIGDVPGWDETKTAAPAKKSAAKKTAAKKATSDDGTGQDHD